MTHQRKQHHMNRRDLLAAAAGAATLAGKPQIAGAASASDSFPLKSDFSVGGMCYLDSGTMHPLSVGARAALNSYIQYRSFSVGAAPNKGYDEDDVRDKFAKLVNADIEEIAFVQSTTAGENLILQVLGLPQRGAHVVTDTLHFFGSMPIYTEMQKAGVDVTFLAPKDGRILIDDIERAVRKGTRLVAVSQVSTINGFEHDLKRVCEIAHAKGALVYADIIHAAGCVPVDLHGIGVDFAACGSYKWLMGDFGLGFLYVRRDRLPSIRAPYLGYHQIRTFKSHYLPMDPPGNTMLEFERTPGAQGLFAQGTFGFPVAAVLNYSLDYLQQLGVTAIQAHAQRLSNRLKEELPRRGYELYTPLEARTPIVTCMVPNARQVLGPVLSAARVKTTLAQNRLRVSVSVFNDMDDVDQLLAALPRRS